MKNKTAILFLMSLLSFLHAYAQYPGPIWYFGDYAGIDFRNENPIILSDGQTYTQEGCSVLTDINGQLFFYSDGVTVWTKEHQVMENGNNLLGNSSSSQSSVIIPMPGSISKYYIFTVDYINGTNGLNYSIVDMELNAGLGAVTVKNSQINSQARERVTAISHENNIDFWLLIVAHNTNRYYAYLVTEEGISTNPVITTTGNILSNTTGYLKPSADGDRIISPNWANNSFTLFEFDRNAGILTNPVVFENYQGVYGSEFSSDGTKLYVHLYHTKKIYQFDLAKKTSKEIVNSGLHIGTSSGNYGGAMQIAPDSKIYITKQYEWNHGVRFLGVINNPNLSGTACDFNDIGLDLQNGRSRLGLPNFAVIKSPPLVEYEYDCFYDTTQFWIQNLQQFDSVIWNFDDPSSGIHNTSNLLEPQHVFTSPGTYEVSVTIYHNATSTTLEVSVEIFPSPIIDLGQDTIICEGDILILVPGANYESYIWQDGSTMPVFTVYESGLYWVEVSNSFGCIQSDSVFVTVSPKPEVWLGNDSILCAGDTLILCTDPGYASYVWQDGSGENCFTATNSGTFWVELTNEFGCSATDSIQLTFLGSSDFSLGNDTIICFDQTLTLDAGWGYDNYLWHDGSTGQTLVIEQSGNYWVEVSSKCGIGSDTISVEFNDYFEVSLGNDTSFCYGHNTILDPGSGFVSYFWQDGSNSQTYTAASSGIYWVIVSDSVGCTATDSVYIDVYSLFDISLGDDTIAFCKGDYIFLHGPEGYENYLWQDGSAFPSILADEEGLFWLEVADANGCSARDSIYVMEAVIPVDLLGPDRHICPDEMITIAALPGFSTYYWQDGSSNPTFATELPGKYWVVVQDENGCNGTDTISINPFKIPDFGLEPAEPICPGDSLLLAVDEGHLHYSWQNSNISSHSLWVSQEGFYHIRVETQCGTFADSVEVYVHYGNLDLGNDTVIRAGEQLQLYPGSGYSQHFWNTGSYDSTIMVNEAGIYWLEAFDGVCLVTDTIKVDIFTDILIPNVFTPNNDGFNDTFHASTTYPDGIYEFKMVIFNRWGNIVHTLENINDAWDGTINGTEVADGVYFWVCNYAIFDLSGKVSFRKKQGSVTLIR